MKQIILKNWSWLILGLLVLFGVAKVYFQTGFPYTHDGENHLARFANYKIALKEGQFPPRLAPNLLNHFTYPVLNFNYPLANILSLPFSFIKLNYEITFKILALSALVLAGVGSQQWLKILGFNPGAQRFALLAFFSAPFLINTLWFRGNIGELLALALFPTALWLTSAWQKKPQQSMWLWWLGVVAIGILLAHNIAALMLVPLLVLYGLLVPGWKAKFQLALTWILAGLSTLWFWLPALAEKNTIVLDDAKFFQDYLHYFVTPNQLLMGPLTFGFVYPGSISGLNLSLGILLFLVLTLSVIWGIRRYQEIFTPAGLLVLICLAFIYLQTQSSTWVWQLIPVLKYLQFPWRLTLPLIVLALPLLAFWWQWASQHKTRWLQVLLGTALLVQVVPTFKLKAADYFHKTIVDYDAYGQTTSTQNENLPKGYRFIEFGDWQPTPTILSGEGSIIVQAWSGTKRFYTLHLTKDSTIVEPSIVWLGYETFANGQRVSYYDNDEIQGRLAYQLPAGDYRVSTTFTQHTWARQWGNGISLVVLLSCAGYFAWNLAKNYVRKI